MIDTKFAAALELIIGDKNEGKTLAIAVSGGSDSMALAILVKNYCNDKGINCIALTVDHGLRKDSKNEAIQVKNWLKPLGYNHEILTWEGAKPESNIQAEARKARYQLLTKYCIDNNIKSLLLAHHIEDQAETVVMRLLRGSSLNGLQAMLPIRSHNKINIIRPLLGFTKSELQELLISEGQKWIEDPSNQNIDYDRVWLRKMLATHRNSSLLHKRLAETVSRLQQTQEYLSSQIDQYWQENVRVDNKGYVWLDKIWFNSVHREIQYQIFHKAIKIVSGRQSALRYDSLNKALDVASKEEATRHTLGGCIIHIRNKEIFIYREPSDLENKKIRWENHFLVSLPSEDYKIEPLGKSNFEKITGENNIEIDKKLPKAVFYTLPSIWHLDNLVAIPHMGYYKNSDYKDIKCNFIYNETYYNMTKP